METIIIADTDVVIDFFSGVEPVSTTISELIRRDNLALTSVTLFELYAGIIGKKQLKQIEDLISVILVFPLDKKETETAATIYNELKQTGNLIGNQDILIAAICITHDLPLITRNTAHFSGISHLKFFDLYG